jgi:hypothetical protein
VKVREPVARPLDVIAAELLLSASQAFLAGVLLYLAVGVWDDRGVGFGPVAVILAGLAAVIVGGWLYWLMGGVGWPLAAANVPAAMFLGFALVLGWRGEDLFRVEGVPLLLSLAASVYGIICGVFLDSPRRWRWDQRQRPRAGTTVPRVSPRTRTFVASVPRTLPRRPTATAPIIEAEPAAERAAGTPTEDLDAQGRALDEDWDADLEAAPGQGDDAPPGSIAPGAAGTEDATTSPGVPGSRGATMPTERLDEAARAGPSRLPRDASSDSEADAIELPTSIEPKAQRSPWAWAAPPEWTRDEDDQPPSSGSSSSGR